MFFHLNPPAMPLSDTATLHHSCFLVNDMEKSASALAKSLAVQWNLWTIEPKKCTLHGQEVSCSFRIALASAGNASLELVTPVSGSSIYKEALAKNGEGFHHICYSYDNPAKMREARQQLQDSGHQLLQSASTEGAFDLCYFQLPEAGLVLELLHLQNLPDPEKQIG